MPSRTKTGRRLYDRSLLDEFIGLTRRHVKRKVVAYCRVSSQAQKPDLKNQRNVIEDFCVAAGKDGVEFVEEIGGGLNFRRKKFLELIDAIVSGDVEELIIAHRDRLCRFGFELLQHLAAGHDCNIVVINSEKLSPEQEMVQDLMTIIHCFSSRLYGLRNYRKALKKALADGSVPQN